MVSLPAASDSSPRKTSAAVDYIDNRPTDKSEASLISISKTKTNNIPSVVETEPSETEESMTKTFVETNLCEVKSDLCISDEEDSNLSEKSEEDANEGDKEESGDEKVVKPVVSENVKATLFLIPVRDEVEPSQEAIISTPLHDISSDQNSEQSVKNTPVPSSEDVTDIHEDKVDELVDISKLKPEKIDKVETPSLEIESVANEEGNDSSIQKTKDFIEVEDPDDYLLFLEQILKSIHEAFYSLHGDMQTRGESKVPDVKNVIPYVRKKVLKVCFCMLKKYFDCENNL